MQEADDIPQKLSQVLTTQMIKRFSQVNLPKLHRQDQTARGISFYMNSDKITEFMCFKQNWAISTLSGKHEKLVDQFIYLVSNVSGLKSDVSIRIESHRLL